MFWTRELIARNAPVRRRIGPLPAPPSGLGSPLRDRAIAAYLGLALGDALGATVEFLTPREISLQYGLHADIIGGGWLRLKAGQVTDDTTMSLALGEALLQNGKIAEARHIAIAFDQWMRAKPVDIGNTVRRNLVLFRRTGNPEAPASEHDAGNGALMRVLPVALASYGQAEAVWREACHVQGHVTHHNPLSDAACETVVAMLHGLLDGRTLSEIRPLADELARCFPVFAFEGKRVDNPSGDVAESLAAVFQALFSTHSFEDCLVDIVNRGGDADTTGALAGMLAGACYGQDALPKRWLRALDPNIRHRCQQQAEALIGG